MSVTDIGRHRRPRTAWVLGGGGNLGSVQVGMLQALAERGEVPDLVIGCSVGSLNGLVIAADPTPDGVGRLRERWLEVDGETIFPSGRASGPWMLLRRTAGLYSSTGLGELVERWAPFERIEDAPIPYECVATNLRTGAAHWFDRGPVRPAVMASAALPAAFPPVEIAGQHFIDGGVVDNVPIWRAVTRGAERIVVLHVGNFDRPRPLPRRPIDVLVQSFSIARNHRFVTDLDRVPADVEMVVLPAIDPGSIRRNDFSRSEELMERSRVSTAAFLDLQGAARSG